MGEGEEDLINGFILIQPLRLENGILDAVMK